MNKKITYIASTLLLTTLLFVSCKNIFSHNNSVATESDADGKTYLCLKVNNSRETFRSLAPQNTQPFDITAFTDFSLIGKPEGEEGRTLLEADTYDDLPQKIEIMSGQWNFYLYAKYNNIEFVAEQKLYIMSGKQNNITFTLKPFEQVGGCEISFTLTNTQVSKVEVTLKRSSDGEIILDKSPLQISEKNGAKTVTLKRSMAVEQESLTSGRYYAKFDFYTGEDDSKGYALLNEYESYLIITAAFTTSANITLDFNELYTIIYKYITDSGEAVELVDAENFALASNSFVPFYYSKGSEITLPEAKQNKKIFLGWKNSDGQPIEKIEKGSSGNLELTADFMDPVLYVSGTGDDPTGDGSEENPFESIDKACEKIIEVGTPDAEWTIYIDGDVTGPHSSDKKAGARGSNAQYDGDIDFGRSEIPATLTTDYAKSILLIGKTGLDANGYPQDMLNRGLIQGASAYPFPTGNVLAVATTVPVTIKNLKITGGNNSSIKANSTNDPYYANGGGLNVAAGATVTLDDGVLITKNKAVNGGAVYNAGTLYMVGSATIGDKTVQTYPQATVTVTNGCSNEYTKGGGIYNTGTVYLGTTSGRTLEGGIYNSYGSSAYGGGLYNAGSGTIFMSSGNIKYNDGQQHGGGVYLESGTFTMTGGELFFNSTAGKGGGVYVSIDAVFYFGGGTISGNNANSSGGGVYIDGGSNGTGKMFMYGNAVIGNSSATSLAPEIISGETADEKAAMSDGCNMAPSGAGVYTLGELYIGYSSQDVTAPLTGGIFYNSAKVSSYSYGGALYIGSSSYPKVFMNSGTINYNYAREGEGIYLYSTKFTMSSLTVGSDTYIPEIPQNIRLAGTSYYINIDSLLDSAANGTYSIVPSKNSSGDSATSYSSNAQILKLTDAAKAQNITIDKVKDKFAIETFTNPRTGIVSNWIIDSNGKLAQKAETINVSSSGTYKSISDAVAQMNDDTKDYIISISGEITGTQTIPETVQANSITIKGATSSGTTSVPGNGINANLADGVEGTALTINTNIPVTLSNIFVKGGHGTEKNGVIIGGGLLLGQNALVCLDNNTRILQNITYDKGNGTPGYGAGVYISDGAKLYENSDCHITENTATSKGAGIYIAAGGCLQTMAESGSYVTLNTFDTNFKDSNNQSITPCGGAVYIDNGATHEMFGAWFRDNCQDVDNCLGSGIYLSSNGNLKIKGHTEVIQPNVIYMASGAKIEIADSLSPYEPGGSSGRLTARLVLESYTEGSEILQAGTGVTTSTFGSATAKFEIIPQEITGGQKQYWALNNSGQLEKKAGTQLTVSIPTDENDIQVSIQRIVGEEVQTLEPGTHFTGGNKLTFTATDGFDSYKWTIDGEEETDNNAMTIDTTNWTVGNYVIYLEAKDSAGKYYSYTAQIKVGSF